ncbi:DNA cytosine methyltransferase [Mycoplasmopsis mustelae]|uniref:DNA cytosine methyltransferase n=1 Tax=Mycoplasmopsis mustelae TaxID=171289 RepID=UPI001F44F0A6|nr:DNA cytosine methyltransferase [Mycoplasmopsis mustelae]
MKKTLIDLFAGCGGLTYGFYHSGFRILDTVEFWQPAIDTYNLNFKQNVKMKDITDSEVLSNLKTNFANNVDLIVGGFTCQGYSMVGKRSKDDHRNQLYKIYDSSYKRFTT